MTNRPSVQLDLFGDVEAAENAARTVDGIRSGLAKAFIIDTPWPELVSWWLHSDAIEAMLTRGEVKASYRRGPGSLPGWAWAIWSDGLRYESGDLWRGWNYRPRWCIPWPQLHALRDAHPDVTARLLVLADGRGHPRSLGWRWWADPFALHPNGWHPDRLKDEQHPDWYDGCDRPETAYADRLEAWRLALDAIRTADLKVVDTAHTVRRSA